MRKEKLARSVAQANAIAVEQKQRVKAAKASLIAEGSRKGPTDEMPLNEFEDVTEEAVPAPEVGGLGSPQRQQFDHVLVGDDMLVPLLRDNSGPQSATAPKQRHLPAKPIADRSQQKLFSKNFLQSAANIEAALRSGKLKYNSIKAAMGGVSLASTCDTSIHWPRGILTF